MTTLFGPQPQPKGVRSLAHAWCCRLPLVRAILLGHTVVYNAEVTGEIRAPFGSVSALHVAVDAASCTVGHTCSHVSCCPCFEAGLEAAGEWS